MGEAKPEEPEFIAAAKIHEIEDCRDWWRKKAAEFKAQGAVWMRASFSDPDNVLLIEGWKARPMNEGDPRFPQSGRTP